MARESTGRSDPQIVLKLLWGRGGDRNRGPKPTLTVERVVAAAIEVADREGLEAVSMRRVAQQLGVGTMSLYRYVPAKGELLDLMVDTVLGEEEHPEPEADWRAQLEHFAREGLRVYRRHPWVLQISIARPALGPNTIGSWDRMLQALEATSLDGPERVAASQLVGAYLRGAAEQVIDAASAERDTGVSEEDWWTSRQGFWDDYFDEQQFPAITRLYNTQSFDRPLDAFEFGLARVLDGIEAYIQRSGSNGAGSADGGSPQ